MSFFEALAANQYQQMVMGTHGSFRTSAGAVDFLECKARLSNPPDTSPESRLTQHLRPVREALPVSEMNFNQLLQRDLEDHRVAVELVPYLLTPRGEGPAFFPPVVACLLPFSNRLPADHFPAPTSPVEARDKGIWRQTEFGEAFRFDVLLEQENGKEHISKLGRLNWNPESAELVIIDGQHRAMALLAIDRTINKRWTGASEKYKSFYEPMVNRCLEAMNQDQRQRAFEAVELPVAIIWFPELPKTSTQHKAARKVFVDLNKNARPPSQSRLLLLSDNDLTSIFTRELLNGMRTEGAGFPIYAVEYDNPSRDQAANAKWSTLTNIIAVSESVRRLICGPDKFFSDMKSSFVGRDNESQMRLALHGSLDIKDSFPETISDDRVYTREEIDVVTFPPSAVVTLVQQFNLGWGSLLSAFFSRALPFSVHAAALQQLKEGWIPNGEPASSLAKEAMFEGAGLYWTIRDSELHWREENQRRSEEGRTLMPRTDVVNAWAVTESKKEDFWRLRSKAFLGAERHLEDSNDAFLIFSTAASQIGFVLAARALGKHFDVPFAKLTSFSTVLVEALNAAIAKRRLFISRVKNHTINFLPKLDTPYAVHFRYFWLELFGSAEGVTRLSDAGYGASFAHLIAAARQQYRSLLIKVFARRLRDSDPELHEKEALKKAQLDVDQRLRKALAKLFQISSANYDTATVLPGTSLISEGSEETSNNSLAEAEGDVVNGQVAGELTADQAEAEINELDRMLKGELRTDGEADSGD